MKELQKKQKIKHNGIKTKDVPKSTEFKNYIDLIIHKIAVEQEDLTLILLIKKKIRSEVNISPKRFTQILQNTIQPEVREAYLILAILKKYLSDLSINDLFNFNYE